MDHKKVWYLKNVLPLFMGRPDQDYRFDRDRPGVPRGNHVAAPSYEYAKGLQK